MPQYITDLRFAPLAGDEVEVRPLADAVENVLRRAEAKDRLIVAWSTHELDVVKEYSPEHLDRLQARYVNARTFAVYWRNACHAGERPATNTLADYLALIGYRVSDGAGPGNVGKTVAASPSRSPRAKVRPASPTTSAAAGATSASTTSTIAAA